MSIQTACEAALWPEIDAHQTYQVIVSNEDETVLVDCVDEQILRAIEDHYSSLGYYVTTELL